MLDLDTMEVISRVHYEVRSMPSAVITMLENLDEQKHDVHGNLRVKPPQPPQPPQGPINIRTPVPIENATHGIKRPEARTDTIDHDRQTRRKQCSKRGRDENEYETADHDKRVRTYVAEVCLAVMSMIQGIKRHGEKTHQAIYDELSQLHNKGSWRAVLPSRILKEAWENVIRSHILISEKLCPQGLFEKIKARLVDKGRTQHWLIKEEVTSDLVHLDSFFAMSTMAAKHGDHIYTIDFLEAYLFAKIAAKNSCNACAGTRYYTDC